jgi:ribosome-binding protein aMBF1 (putative translation factor)
LPESVRRTLAPVPETRGTPVVVLAPIVIDAPLPAGFVDIDSLVEQEEVDPSVRQAIAAGRQSVAERYYADGPRSLSYYRLRNGWSQKELAGRLGTSQSYIARLEAGDIDLQVSTLNRLAATLDVPPSDLLDAVTAGAKRP